MKEDEFHLQTSIQYISAVFSISINLFLMALIATKSPKQLGAYKYLMMSISIHEIGYSIIDVIVSPLFHSLGSTYMIIVITKNRTISPSVLSVLNGVYCGLFGFSLAIFALHFVYRYLVASGNKALLSTFNSWKFFLWLGGPMFYGVTWGLASHFLLASSEEATRYIRNSVLEVFDLEVGEYVYIGSYFYEKTGKNSYVIHLAPLIGIVMLQGYIGFSLVIVIVFGIKCYNRINALVARTTTSSSYQLLQSQLFNALVTQATIPIILMHFPLGILFIFAFLEWNIGSLSAIVSITIALYPAIDPLPTIFMVKHYRKGVFDWCRWMRNKATRKPHEVIVKSRTQSTGVS